MSGGLGRLMAEADNFQVCDLPLRAWLRVVFGIQSGEMVTLEIALIAQVKGFSSVSVVNPLGLG